MSHPGHQVSQPGAAYRGKVIPGVAKIVEMQAFRADRVHRMRPGGHLVEVAPPPLTATVRGKNRHLPGRRGEGTGITGKQILHRGDKPLAAPR